MTDTQTAYLMALAGIVVFVMFIYGSITSSPAMMCAGIVGGVGLFYVIQRSEK